MAGQLQYADSDETSDDENWFQMKRPSLLKQLQNIMREYPDDVQILYELVQNAEDAKAAKMKIMLNNRNIDPGGSYGKYLKSPALCVYNDAVFEEDDWDGITSVNLSHKENKADKIGRYGQGFKSVFHITDFPVVISGGVVLLMNPFKENKECQRTKLTAFEIKIGKSGILNSFGLSREIIRKGHYNGTLFWFPLRTSVSPLSTNVNSISKIEDTLGLFKNDAHIVLLFLKYLKQIEICSIRGELLHKTKLIFADHKTYDSLCSMWTKIELGTCDTHCVAFNGTTYTLSSQNRQGKQSQHSQQWTVVHFYAGDLDMEKPLTTLAKDPEIACLPYAGVAFPWDTLNSKSGRVFNFLPLPATNKTFLPVHVNANFALSQNRRNLKLSDGKSSDKFVQWNEAVVGKLVPMAYVKLVEYLIELSTKNKNAEHQIKMVYDCMPQIKTYEPFWELCASGFYSNVIQLPVFFTERNNGKWICKDSAILCNITMPDMVSSKELYIQKTIKKVLLHLEKNVIDLHESMKMLIKHGKIIQISPIEIVKYLKCSANVIQRLNRENKINLLHYIMTDSRVEIVGLKLLPIQSGDFESFHYTWKDPESEKYTYVATSSMDSSLFPGQESRFVSQDLPDFLTNKLSALALEGRFQVRILTYKHIPELLDEVFRHHCEYTKVGHFVPKQNPCLLNYQWIRKLWSIISRMKNMDDLQYFEKLPLIPQYHSESSQIVSFHILQGNYILTGYEKNGIRNLPEKILYILQANGIRNLDWNEIVENSHIIGKYIKLPAYESIMELFKNNPKAKKEIQTHVGLRRDLWLPQKTTARSFGQKELLVTRLKGILTSYPRHHSILKEMIQNADDAGAREIHIVYDMRHHKTNAISDNWEPLQGPALCIFNDACFTDKDLEGIEQLGIGSKGDDRTKTGQFGIGFNSVYHLTDAPCILSLGPDAARGGFFWVSDPHCRYAPLASDGDPGTCMDATELQSAYPDVYDTFFPTPFLNRNKGTWFRLPIRNADHEKSQICDSTFCSSDILSLLQTMKMDIEECLLFLLNIKQISISSIDSDSIHKIYCSVRVSDVDDAKDEQSKFKDQLKKMNNIIKCSPSSIFSQNIVEFKYFIDIKFHSKVSSRWMIVQTLGFTDPQEIDKTLKESVQRGGIGFIPRGGVAFQVIASDHSSKNSKAFCLLPLPVETGLPIHVNGQFAIDMSRIKLWGSEESSTSDVRRTWNLELIRRCIAYAYAGGIVFLKRNMVEKKVAITMNDFLESFPLYSTAKNIFWKELVSYVFFYIQKRQLLVYPVMQSNKKEISSGKNLRLYVSQFETKEIKTWIRRHHLGEIPVLVDDLRCQNVGSLKEELLRNCFLSLGMKLITLPTNLQSSMLSACEHLNKTRVHNKDSCICIQVISPKAAIDFFKSGNSGMRDCYSNDKFKSVEQVKLCLEYCLKCEDLKELNGVHLLLKNDKSVETFQNQNRLILSKFVDLLPKSSGRFVHKSLTPMTKLHRLSFEKLTLSEFALLLPKSLDSRFKTNIVRNWNPAISLLSREWLECFWEFVDTTDECLEVLQDWALLPVSMLQKENLLALKFCDIVIDYDSFEKCQQPELYSILQKLHLPTPTLKSTLLETRLVTHENTCNLLRCVYLMRNSLAEANLTETDRVTLVSYLVTGLNPNEKSKIDQLKKLSLFTTMEDYVISLQTTYFITLKEESNMSMPGLENLCKELDLTVLRYYPEWWKLYKIIDCNIINISDWYSKYILPNFEKVCEDFHIFHLNYINVNLLANANVVSALREVCFIRDGLFINRADKYFSPDQLLFEKLCNNTDFPPPPFDDVKWRKLLVNAGLITEISERALLYFTKMIEATSQTKDLFPKLKILLNELNHFMAKEKSVSSQFIQQISKVRFLLIDRNESKYEDIHSSLHTSLRFTSFQETITYDQIELVWTTADVLPRYAMPSDKNILTKLKSIEEPSFEVVMQHTKNICSVLFRSCPEHDETVLTTILGRIYHYFSSRKDRNVSELKGIPLIHIIKHKKFAYPSEVVKNIYDSNEIPPYLLKAPIEYGQFFKLFNCLGMKDEPTVATYSKVLWKINKNCSHSPLGPNEIIMVQKALHCFMRAMQQLEEPVDDLEVDELYLMSENNQLLPANELYYESLEIRRQRLETDDNLHFLADFGCLGINVEELPRLFAMIPERHRPLSVQSIVTERLAFYELNESETALKLLEILTSQTFINAVLRICKHDQKFMSNELTVKDMQPISARLRRLRVFGVSELETKLKRGHVDIDGTKSKKPCFYDDEKEIIYIHDQRFGVDTWLCRYGIELERMLRVVCFGKFQSRSLLGIFNTISSDFDRLHERLTELGIALLEEDLTNLILYPLPGSLVPKEVHPRLLKPLQPISVKQYAVIPCETNKSNYSRFPDSEDIFIYVVVTNAAFSSVGTLQYYMVNVGKQQDIKIDKELILEIQPLGRHTEEGGEYEFSSDESAVDEIDSRPLHNARECHVYRLPNPQKQIGLIWFTQARFDLKAGHVTLYGIDHEPFKGYNWICIQCQQAAEKAVKAAQYASDANQVQRSHLFSANIPKGDSCLSNLCWELSNLIGHVNALRYPDNYRPIPPAEKFNKEHATKALLLTDQILTYVSKEYFM
ncbi:SACS [Mytilus coruscus]|uniref:SACS n=1 Tax=Mytilus coruscus TaxID=42192 RepID=A0A6J8CDJ1_MYTCO|nr:SACS [Mytilus coruscus]